MGVCRLTFVNSGHDTSFIVISRDPQSGVSQVSVVLSTNLGVWIIQIHCHFLLAYLPTCNPSSRANKFRHEFPIITNGLRTCLLTDDF